MHYIMNGGFDKLTILQLHACMWIYLSAWSINLGFNGMHAITSNDGANYNVLVTYID